jgi:hypothetical protein
LTHDAAFFLLDCSQTHINQQKRKNEEKEKKSQEVHRGLRFGVQKLTDDTFGIYHRNLKPVARDNEKIKRRLQISKNDSEHVSTLLTSCSSLWSAKFLPDAPQHEPTQEKWEKTDQQQDEKVCHGLPSDNDNCSHEFAC